jgi:5-methylcytosine-specific restriction endonuclease McrA
MISQGKRSAHSKHYDRVAVYAPRLILSLVGNKCVQFGRHAVRMHVRYFRFYVEKGLRCASCGLEGKYFALERDSLKASAKTKFIYHFNLYAVNSDGVEVLMTKDHIVPISRGGKNGLYNLQMMCLHCNNSKGNEYAQAAVG